MLRTFALLAFGVALIAWGTNYMVSQGSTSRAGMVEDLAGGLMDAVGSIVPGGDEPTPIAAPQTFSIAATGGAGVALRDDCRDDARSGGALSDGTAVTRVAAGEERCAGWSLARYETAAGSSETWVRDDYLGPPAPE